MLSKKYRILAAVFAGVIALGLLAPALASLAYAAEVEATEEEQQKISNLGAQYKELQAKQQEIQQKINETQSEKEKKVVASQQIGAQIDNTTAQIDVLSQRIALLDQNIAQKEREMDAKQAEIDETYDIFKKRLNAMAKVPTGSAIGMVLGAENYSQFVNRTEVTTRVAQYDRELMDRLTKQKEELAEIKSQIEADKRAVESDKKDLDAKRDELSEQKAETQKMIQDISLLEQQFMQNKAAMQEQMRRVQAEIDAIYAEIAKRSTMAEYVGGEMQHPSPSLTQISSPFGSRFGGSDFHTGVDFFGSGAYGQPVLAANDGEVAKVGYSETGYGNFVIIDHGGGITTLYAHNSAILVSEGQKVSRGDQIAQVGSTGWATGPHCHFEVRVNGVAQNPMPYLRG